MATLGVRKRIVHLPWPLCTYTIYTYINIDTYIEHYDNPQCQESDCTSAMAPVTTLDVRISTAR